MKEQLHGLAEEASLEPIAVHGVTRRNIVQSTDEVWQEEIRRNGFAVIENALTLEQSKTIGTLLDSLYEEQVREIGGIEKLRKINDQNIVRSMLVYHEAFVHLANNPLLMPLVKRLLGDNISLSSQVGILNCPTQKNYQEAWHRELQYQHFVCSKPLGIQILYAIDAFTYSNGGTFFLPGSHLFEEFPSDAYVRANQVQIEAPIGSAIVFDAMVYHRGASNHTAHIRRAVNNLYTLPIIQQQIDFAKMLDGKYSDDPELHKLFGYRWRPADDVKEWRERHLKAKH